MAGRCSICKGWKEVHLNRMVHEPVCHNCYIGNFYVAPQEKCFLCGFKKPVALRTEKEEPICLACYKRWFWKPPTRSCLKCGSVTSVKNRSKQLCHTCYNRWYYRVRLSWLVKKKPAVVKRLIAKLATSGNGNFINRRAKHFR